MTIKPSRQPRALIALIALVAVAALLVGCGGDETSDTTTADGSDDVAGAVGSESKEKQKRGSDARAPEEGKRGRDGSGSNGGKSDPESVAETTRREIENIPPKDRASFASRAAANYLSALGFRSAEVSLNVDGSVMRVLFTADEACTVDPAEVGEIERGLKDALLVVRVISLELNTGGRLASYVRANCQGEGPPAASGSVVYSKSGSGLVSSKKLSIDARRFTVSYSSTDAIEIYVTEGKKLLKPAVREPAGGSGTKAYKGPGEYVVTVTGPGRWQVKVYDGT